MDNISPLPEVSPTIKSDNFLKSIIFVAIFLTLTPITLATSVFALITVSEHKKPIVQAPETAAVAGVQVYASLPSTLPSISTEPVVGDARPELIRQYLNRYDSPLEPYALFIVETADTYGIDFRLIPAIAQQESNLCKKIPPETFNCWGWGIHSKGTLGFQSYQEGIEIVTKGIREEYVDKGYVTIEDIMAKYTPMSQGSWANGVNTFMNEME
jgi:hypothetical protein